MIPTGFVAHFGDEQFEYRYDRAGECYRTFKHWKDDYNGQPRSCPVGIYHPADAEAFIKTQAETWRSRGWKIVWSKNE